MQRLSISQFSSYQWSFFQDVINYAKFRFNSIGLWRSKVEDFGFDEAADLLTEMQLDVSSFSWAGGFTGSEGMSHSAAVDDCIEAVRQARTVGASKLIVHPGSRNGHTEPHAIRLLKSGIDEVLPAAKDLGVQLLLEPVASKRNCWNFLNGCESYHSILAEFCPSELGLVIDLFHVGRDKEFVQRLPSLANRIELVQLSDGGYREGQFSRCELGTGNIPVEAWINLLTECQYAGDFEIELHGCEFENADYQFVLNKSREYFATATEKVLSGVTSI